MDVLLAVSFFTHYQAQYPIDVALSLEMCSLQQAGFLLIGWTLFLMFVTNIL